MIPTKLNNNLAPLTEHLKAAGIHCVARGTFEELVAPYVTITQSPELLAKELEAWSNTISLEVSYNDEQMDFPERVDAALSTYTPVAGTDYFRFTSEECEPDSDQVRYGLIFNVEEIIQL